MGLFESLFPDQAMALRLERVERKLDQIMKFLDMPEPALDPAVAEVAALARDPRRKIEANKRYREITGVGLAEAKAAVEDMAR